MNVAVRSPYIVIGDKMRDSVSRLRVVTNNKLTSPLISCYYCRETSRSDLMNQSAPRMMAPRITSKEEVEEMDG